MVRCWLGIRWVINPRRVLLGLGAWLRSRKTWHLSIKVSGTPNIQLLSCIFHPCYLLSHFPLPHFQSARSILSPTFEVYINDINSSFHNSTGCSIILYADDILLLSPFITELERLLHCYERELNYLDINIFKEIILLTNWPPPWCHLRQRREFKRLCNRMHQWIWIAVFRCLYYWLTFI